MIITNTIIFDTVLFLFFFFFLSNFSPYSLSLVFLLFFPSSPSSLSTGSLPFPLFSFGYHFIARINNEMRFNDLPRYRKMCFFETL